MGFVSDCPEPTPVHMEGFPGRSTSSSRSSGQDKRKRWNIYKRKRWNIYKRIVLFPKENCGIGPGEPWAALPPLAVLCIPAPSLGCFYHTQHQHCPWQKRVSSLARQDKYRRRKEVRLWMAYLNSRLQSWCVFHPAERKPQSLSEPGSCTKFSAHQWVMIFQHCSPWLPLAIIFIPFSQLVPCLHDRWKY